MDRIYKFDEFTLILESMENNNDELLRAIEKVAPKKNFVRWTIAPKFGGVYTRPSEKYPGLDEIVCKWGDEEWVMSDVYYKDGDFYSVNMENLSILEDPSDVKYLKGVFKFGNFNYFENIRFHFRNWLLRMLKTSGEINPFEHGVENMPIIKELESKGMKIVSSPIERSWGRLVLRFPNAIYDYAITRLGDIGRKKPGKKISKITVYRKELIKEIYKLDDLVPKIKFVYMLYLLDLAKSKGLPEESFKKILLVLVSERGIDDPSYKKEYDKIIREYPEMALYLPEPGDGGNKELIKGAKIINRLGLF